MLLLDENISYRITKDLSSSFSGIKYIKDFLNYGASDDAIWETAFANNLTIVSFDSDYEDMLILRGFPPKIIWLRMGNSTTHKIVQIIRNNQLLITEFLSGYENGCLELY